MTDFVKQHVALLVVVLVVWFTHARVSERDASASDRKKLEPIAPRYLAVRSDDAPPRRLADPYRFTEPEAGPEEPSTADASPDDEGDVLASRSQDARGADGRAPDAPSGAGTPRGAGPGGPGGGPPAAGADARPSDDAAVTALAGEPVPTPAGAVELWVDAVVAVRGGGAARVCGVNVVVGEEVPGVDDAAPPVLVGVEGTHAVVRYRGADHVVAIDAPPVVVEPPPGPGAPTSDDGWFPDWWPGGRE